MISACAAHVCQKKSRMHPKPANPKHTHIFDHIKALTRFKLPRKVDAAGALVNALVNAHIEEDPNKLREWELTLDSRRWEIKIIYLEHPLFFFSRLFTPRALRRGSR